MTGELSGTDVVITGGHAGIGLEVTRALSTAGAAVVVGARNPARAMAALVGTVNVEVDRLDLIDPRSVDAFAERRLASGRPLHLRVNNAGAPVLEDRVLDSRGYETQFATNHLGHFQLTDRLLPALESAQGARVVTVSSGAHRLSGIRWDDLHFSHGYDGHLAYGQSKTANVLFSVELDRRWAGASIRGYAVHPGIVAGTTLNSSVGAEVARARGLMDESGQPIVDLDRGVKDPERGASTIVFAATSPQLAGIGGVYLRDNDISPLDENPEPFTGQERNPSADVVAHAIDPDAAVRLWRLSEQLVGW